MVKSPSQQSPGPLLLTLAPGAPDLQILRVIPLSPGPRPGDLTSAKETLSRAMVLSPGGCTDSLTPTCPGRNYQDISGLPRPRRPAPIAHITTKVRSDINSAKGHMNAYTLSCPLSHKATETGRYITVSRLNNLKHDPKLC